MGTGILKTAEEYIHEFADILTTTDATVTTVLTIPVPVSRGILLSFIFIGTKNDFTEAIGGSVVNIFRRGSSGNIFRVGAERSTINRDNGFVQCDCYVEIDYTGFNLLIRVKGKASNTIKWTVETDYLIIS